MASIKIKTPDVSNYIQTSLSSDYQSGTSLSVVSSTSFINGAYIVVGGVGLDKTEITHLTATPPNQTTLTIASLQFSHPAGTPVSYVDFDKYELSYRTISTNPWIIYPGMPDNLVFDALNKEYRDAAALNNYQWRYRYFSTEKNIYSDYSDTIGTAGWGRSSVGYMIKGIRKIVNDPEEKTIKDAELIRFLNAAQDKIYSLYDRWWFLLHPGTPILTQTGIKQYPLPSDFGRMHLVSYEFVNGANDVTYNLASLSNTEFDYAARDNNAAFNDDLKYYSVYPGDSINPSGYLKVWPAPLTAGLNIIPRYYKLFTDLTSYGNQTEVPIPDILENYVIARILAIRKEDDKASEYDSMWKEQIQLLKLMQRKDAKPIRSLWRYRGATAEKRLFGTRDVYSDTTREQYWTIGLILLGGLLCKTIGIA